MEVEVKAILDSGGAADVSIPFVGITKGEAPVIMKNPQLSGVAHKSWGGTGKKSKGRIV